MRVRITKRIACLRMAVCLLVIASALAASAGEIALLRNGFTIRHEHHAVMGLNTRLYLDGSTSSYVDVPTAEIQSFEKDLVLPPAPQAKAHPVTQVAAVPATDLNQVVNSASASFHLDPDLVNSVIHAESGFNSRAVSRKGARGLMQLMPGTASQLGVENAFDPQANVTGGSRYLRELLERYNFDLVKALAAYNAGPDRVEHYNGVPPFRETQAYVARIVHEYNRKKTAQQQQVAAARAASTRNTTRKSKNLLAEKPAPRTGLTPPSR